MDAGTYHALELRIAANPDDTRRCMPTILPHHRSILDVGCGAGQTLIASRLPDGVEAVGVDVDTRALAAGRCLDPRIRFICSSGESLPFPPERFDLLISRVALPYMHNGVALAEMCRVLKPGGTLWLTLHPFSQIVREFATHVRHLELKRALYRLYVAANGLLAHLTGREIRNPLNGRYESFQTGTGIRRRLEKLGFGEIRIDQRLFFVVQATKGLSS